MKVITIVTKFRVAMALKSICMKVGARLGIAMPLAKLGITENMPWAGSGT